jgi:single-stranded-DNA-specific exonuclease
VNPNQPDCAFPSKNLAGVGVIFYVLLALRAKMREAGDFSQQRAPNLACLLDLVALGTVADVVKLDSNNRILVAQGLKRIRAGQARAGITALFTVSGRHTEQAGAFDLGFTLGPRINAAGRLQDMSLGVACLLTEDMAVAIKLAQQLDQLNRDRRHIETHIQAEAQAILASLEVHAQHSVSLFHPDWHQGVIGIIASRIKEQYHRPCFVFAQGKSGEIKGSGRSISGLHLRDTLDLLDKEAPGLLQRFGGHAMAAGVTILQQDFIQFATLFEQLCGRLLDEASLQKSLYVDGTPPKAAYTLPQVERLDNQIWGQGFQPPLFIDQFEIVSQRIVGEKHLKLQLKSLHGQLLEAMRFQSTELLPPVFSGVFRLQVNTFQQRQMVQLIFQHVI